MVSACRRPRAAHCLPLSVRVASCILHRSSSIASCFSNAIVLNNSSLSFANAMTPYTTNHAPVYCPLSSLRHASRRTVGYTASWDVALPSACLGLAWRGPSSLAACLVAAQY